MDEAQLQQLLNAHDTHWLEILYWLAGIVVAGVAAYALYYADEQIRAARDNTKALFLIDIDGRWEGREMKEARTKWRNLRTLVYQKIKDNHDHLSTKNKQIKSAEICSEELYKMLQNQSTRLRGHLKHLGVF